MFGVIGSNGAGKTTLLQILSRVVKPTRGKVRSKGRIGALVDLGAGFHSDLTGRENIFINGLISGLTRREVAADLDAIVAFAELEEFIDSPLRMYSMGMRMRLAFAVATQFRPEILLVDEVLAVGDLPFQKKCLDRIQHYREEGSAVVFVSHNLHQVSQLCDEALWLRSGEVAASGPAGQVIEQYLAVAQAETKRRTPESLPAGLGTAADLVLNVNRFGSLEMAITGVRLAGPDGSLVTELETGMPLRVEVDYFAPQPIKNPIISVTLTGEDGSVCYDTSTAAAQIDIPRLEGSGRFALNFERLDLIGNRYFIDVGVFKGDWSYAYDYHWHVYPIMILSRRGEKGILRPPTEWEFTT
jgi:lipopolysaccharide transport system ATP-binding protein